MLESSGLLKVRPPLPAAASGDDFYHAIPFQVCLFMHGKHLHGLTKGGGQT